MSPRPRPWLLAGALALGAGALAAAPLVLDDADAACQLSGTWAGSDGRNGEGKNFGGAHTAVGGHYRYTSSHPPYRKTGRETATWRPRQAGRFRVEVSFRATENRSAQVRYRVHHAGGTAERTVSQRGDGSMRWADLGTYRLEAESRVELASDGGGSACADALRLTPAGDAPGEDSSTQTGVTVPLGEAPVLGVGEAQAPRGARPRSPAIPTGELILTRDRPVVVRAKLATYGPAQLRVDVVRDGAVRPWLRWAREHDKDGSPMLVDGEPDPASITWQGEDPSAAERVYRRALRAGDEVRWSLEGRFGDARPRLEVR